MAEEIAKEGKINVRRHDRDFLLNIRKGELEYDDLVKIADDKIANIHLLFEKSDLPDAPDRKRAEDLLIEIRSAFYEDF
jgi:hypothetical protein